MIQFVVNDWLMSRNTSDCSKYSLVHRTGMRTYTKGTVYVKKNFRKCVSEILLEIFEKWMITGCTNSTVIGSYKSLLEQKKEKSRLLY